MSFQYWFVTIPVTPSDAHYAQREPSIILLCSHSDHYMEAHSSTLNIESYMGIWPLNFCIS